MRTCLWLGLRRRHRSPATACRSRPLLIGDRRLPRPDDALHSAAADALGPLVKQQRLLVSVVTFAEVISEILPVDVATAERAAVLRSGQKALRMPDALILAAADLHPEVESLLTGDPGLAAVGRVGCRVDLFG